jgi:hypothetical protein
MRRIARKTALVVYVAVLAEAGAMAYFALTVGGFYWTSPTLDATPPWSAEKLRLHPYFGWVNTPRSSGNAVVTRYNNLGFLDPTDPPTPADGEFVVGIFGGSVALNAAMEEFQHRRIISRLKASRGLSCKNVRILNLAKEGYKQPQQFFVLAHYLLAGQRFDVVLNIDGFNEVSSGWINVSRGIELTMPGADTYQALAALTDGGISGARLKGLRALHLRRTASQCALAQCWLAKTLWADVLSSGVSEALRHEPAEPLVMIEKRPGAAPADDGPFLERLADSWEGASLGMKLMTESFGGLYIGVLQPNQYFRTKREFGDEEKSVAFLAGHPYAEKLQRGYESLRARGSLLSGKGLRFFDATSVFDDISEPVYRDNCCHFNARGEAAFANFLAEAVATVVEKNRPQKCR